jgi:hypothetical protein
MQDYQISLPAPSADFLGFLIPPCAMSSTRKDKRTGRTVDGPAVPVSPGLAIRLRPYPPSHRRRQ